MSLPGSEVLDRLGTAVAYPTTGYRASLAECERFLMEIEPEAATAIGNFREAIENLEDWELQELFTRTFDLNPQCTLEVGWHLYGEQYRRGRFLVKTRELLAKVGIEEQSELPDHLMYLLPAVARLVSEEAAVFAGSCLAPAVQKMVDGLEGKANPYSQVLRAVQLVLGPATVDTPRVGQHFDQHDLVQIGNPQTQPTLKGTVS